MDYNRFPLGIGIRVFLLTAVMAGLVFLFIVPGYPTASVILAGIAILQISELFRYVARTNAELMRFLDAARYADFSQRFDVEKMGAGFDELGDVFSEILKRFQQQRADQEVRLRHLKALTEHVPVPLLSLHPDGKIDIHNNAARRLFGIFQVERLDDIDVFGVDFSRQLQAVRPGERRLATFVVDELEQRLTLSATEVVISGCSEKLVSLQNIQSELDGAQLQAWQDLVRVLTHEIMNSITPVTSLAKTAADLVDDAVDKFSDHAELSSELADVKSAVETVARRSDGLMQFVQGYHRLTRLPPPQKQLLPLSELFSSLEQLVSAQWVEKAIQLSLEVEPKSLELWVDREMIEQVLINLLRNAEQALAESTEGKVMVRAKLNRQGHIFIEVNDNGPGVPDDVAQKIFVPFYTTKREGSGVGLALTRQVMLAHGGSVSLGVSDLGGAKFTLTF